MCFEERRLFCFENFAKIWEKQIETWKNKKIGLKTLQYTVKSRKIKMYEQKA